MGRLIYELNVSVDGYVEDPAGSLEWQTIDEELHRWFNEDALGIDAFLYGRRMYETMAGYWPYAESDPNATDYEREWARLWLDTPKIVFSSTLESVDWNSRLIRDDPVVALARLRDEFPRDLGVGGPMLASALIAADQVDEYRLLVHPAIVGGGKPFWPRLERPMELELVEERRFGSGVVLNSYRRTGR